MLNASKFHRPWPLTLGGTQQEDTFLASRADLVNLIWDRRNEETRAFNEWLSATGKDHIIGFI